MLFRHLYAGNIRACAGQSVAFVLSSSLLYFWILCWESFARCVAVFSALWWRTAFQDTIWYPCWLKGLHLLSRVRDRVLAFARPTAFVSFHNLCVIACLSRACQLPCCFLPRRWPNSIVSVVLLGSLRACGAFVCGGSMEYCRAALAAAVLLLSLQCLHCIVYDVY